MFTLNQVVPWGRSYDEYRAMFALLDDDLNKPILGCGDGPASFNAEATRRGYDVISVDPIYAFDAEAIRSRINDTYPTVIEQLAAYRDQYVWDRFATPDALGQARLAAMNRFLADYPDGKARGRYRTGQLPDLPFDTHTFHLALCSHLLFLYSDHLDEAFHVASVRELCRIAQEVRIFPLTTLAIKPSPHLAAVETWARQQGYRIERVTVDYEFQRGSNTMLRIQCA
ncbi:MAG: SAM-dependent methyltransferase [Chloroflexota bacterium]